MTLADSRPQDPVGVCVSLERLRASRADGKTLRMALLLAVMVHAVAFLIPLPSRNQPERPLVFHPGPIIVKPDLKPPPPPERPAAPTPEPRSPTRLLPVPKLPEEYTEPAPEIVDLPALSPAEPGEVPFYLETPVAPAPSGPLAEQTEGLVRPVRLPGSAKPEYPAMARAAKLEGSVILEAIIDETGAVTSIRVIDVSGFDAGFAEAAEKAVSSWRYTPGLYGGEPVGVVLTVVVDFRIQ